MAGQSTKRRNVASKNGALLTIADAGRMVSKSKISQPKDSVPHPLSQARLLGIIRSSMEAITTTDKNQRIVMFNPMAERLFGCPASEALDAPLERFVPERFRAAHAVHVRQFGVTGVSDRQMGGTRTVRPAREWRRVPNRTSISQFDDDNGKLYTVMLRDITPRLEAERALQRSHQELRELSANLLSVREEEKSRIARELHDDLGQQLSALKMDVASLELAPGTDPDARAQLRGMQRLIDATVASTRRIAADLRPVMLDDLGLVPSIEWLVNDFTNRYGIQVQQQIDVMHTDFSRDGSTTIFRIVQEALTNVARHSRASYVELELRQEAERCVARIVDDGQGADERADARRKSFGLIGIRERAYRLNGSVSIETAVGQGFAMIVTLPLAAVQDDKPLFE